MVTFMPRTALAVALGAVALAGCTSAQDAITPDAAMASGSPSPTPIATGAEVRDATWTASLGAESWAAPALLGDVIVVGDNDGMVHGLDLATGARAWTAETGGDVRAQAAVDGDTAFVISDDGSLYALAADGSTEWVTELGPARGERGVWDNLGARPAVADGVVFAATDGGVVAAVDTETGTPLWSADLESPVESNLALADGILHVSTMGRVHYALDADDGTVVWQVEEGTEHTTSPAVIDGKVLVGSRSARLTAYDAATGEKAWAKSFGSSWVQSGAADLGDGTFVIGSSDTRAVQAFNLDDVSTPVWYSPTTGWPWSIPAVADGVVYGTQMMIDYQEPWDTAVYALDAADGHVLWSAEGGDALEFAPDGYAMYGVGSSPLIAGAFVIVAGLDGVVRAFER